MLNCLFFRIFSSVRMKWVWASARYLAFGRTPGHRRLAKCDAGSSQTGGFFPLRRGLSALGWNIVPAFFGVARMSAQRGLFPLCRAHTRSQGRKPHTVATRASRCAMGDRHAHRVDRVDFFRGGKIGTIAPFQADEALSVALSERYENTVFS